MRMTLAQKLAYAILMAGALFLMVHLTLSNLQMGSS